MDFGGAGLSSLGGAPSCPGSGGKEPKNESGNQEGRKPVNSRTAIFDRIYMIFRIGKGENSWGQTTKSAKKRKNKR
jgi:hypothetical protein